MLPDKNIDIKENELLKIDSDLLAILLQDKTTGRNIIWATDNYLKYGEMYSPEKEIQIELITSRHGGIIKPRIQKSKEEQQRRVRQKSEVFTPSWVCNLQNNSVDEQWFGRKNVFNMENDLWPKVLNENIYVICKTEMAKKITKRTLAGFTDAKVNAHYFEDLVNQLKNKSENFIGKVTSANYWSKEGSEDMKFDAVVGNPPYQTMAAGDANGSDPIYHLFIDAACKIGPRVSFIHPARFLFNAGKTPKDWNQKMLNDKHYKVVDYWADSNKVFPTVDIKGGVAVTYWDKTQNFGKIGTFVAFEELKSIKNKVVINNFISLSSIMNVQTKYNFTNLYQDYPQYKNIIGSDGADKRLRPNAFDKLDIFKDKQQQADDIPIHGLIKNKRVIRYINLKYLEKSVAFEKYKILVPKANGTGSIGEVLSTPLIGYTGSFIGIGAFDTELEARNCLKYVKSKFARTMLGTLKLTQHNPKATWANVPLQDFTEKSDIDWTKSVPEIDAQLYKKYALSKDEIAFIEKMIKPME